MVDAAISSVCNGKGWIEVEANPTQPSYLIRPSDRIQSILIRVLTQSCPTNISDSTPKKSICLKQLSFACTDKGCVLRPTASKHLWHVVLPCPPMSRLLQLPPSPSQSIELCSLLCKQRQEIQAKSEMTKRRICEEEGIARCLNSLRCNSKFNQNVFRRGGWGWFIWGGGIARRLTRSYRKRHMSPQVCQPAQTPE